MKQTQKYAPKVTKEIESNIIELTKQQKTVSEISKILGISRPTVVDYLHRNEISSYKKPSPDTSRICVVCNQSFVPKNTDGPKKDKYKLCSPECVSKYFSQLKTKYTDEQVSEIIKLKKEGMFNKDIASKVGVNKSKVVTIIREYGLQVDKDTLVRHILEGKTKADPNFLEKMRANITKESYEKSSESNKKTFQNPKYRDILSEANKDNWTKLKDNPEKLAERNAKVSKSKIEAAFGMTLEEYEELLLKVKKELESDNETMQTVCKKYGLSPITTIKKFHKRGWSDLVYKNKSSGQLEIFQYIQSILSGEIFFNDRTALGGVELDIYISSKKFGIEYNGLYWHSTAIERYNTDGKIRWKSGSHTRKKQLCAQKGISLLAIYEDEWLDTKKQELVKKMIKYRLGIKDAKTLNIRDLRLERLCQNNQFSDFFNKFHLDGHVSASFAYGFFLEDKLVFCASFRTSRDGMLEIARLASDYDYSVPGALGKILKLIDVPLMTYSNNRLSDGNIYKQNGFVDDTRTTNPSYWYTDFETRIWRFKCKRINNPEILAQYPTEKEQALGGVFSQKIFGDDRPLYRIEDYGHRRWIWYPKSPK
jgi:transposase